jgi:hypothetical protein
MTSDKLDDAVVERVEKHPEASMDPPARVGQIQCASDRLGFPFPPSYVRFLTYWNGGELNGIRFCACDKPGTNAVFDLFGEARPMREYIEGMHEGDVYPFACNYGGDWYCFDLRHPTGDGEFPILRWNHEAAEEPGEELWTPEAPDFGAFLARVADDYWDG